MNKLKNEIKSEDLTGDISEMKEEICGDPHNVKSYQSLKYLL